MKHEHQNTLKESDEEEVAKVVQIELAAPGSRPLPATLVTKLVKERIAENEKRAKK